MSASYNNLRSLQFANKLKSDFVSNKEATDIVLPDMKYLVDQLNIIFGIISGTNVITKSYTIGAPGVAGCDYNFTSAANTTEQSIQLGATTIIPATSPLTSLVLVCQTGLNGAITGTIDIGKTSGTDEYMSSVDVDDTNEIISVGQQVMADVAASSVYFSMTPSANWSTITTGKWKIWITFNDNTLI